MENENLIGKTYSKLTVISITDAPKNVKNKGRKYFLCACACGNSKVVRADLLKSGNTTSCGCVRNEKLKKVNFKDMTAQVFGSLTVVERAEKPKNGTNADAYWKLSCKCGEYVTKSGAALRSGKYKSHCGCQDIKPKKAKKRGCLTYDYGMSFHDGYYIARVPLYIGTITKKFSDYEAAKSWQLMQGIKEWGSERWPLLGKGRLSVLRKPDSGVSIRLVHTKGNGKNTMTNRTYVMFGVFWYDHDQKPKSQYFSHKRYGDRAELVANWFAAKQRAELSGSELNLPQHWTIDSFDLDNAVEIRHIRK